MSIRRRTALDLGLAALTAAACPLPARAVASAPAGGPQIGDAFVLVGDRTRLVTVETLRAGGPPERTWPMDRATGLVRDSARFNQVLLLRPPIAMASAAGEAAVLAFTAICPHAGCVVTGWVPEAQRLLCPCHESHYDPWKGGAVISGPSPLPLPTLPVRVTDGLITVAGPFSARPGGHTSRTM